MKKHLIALILSFSLGLLLESSMVVAKQTTMSTYYPSSSGAYTKVLLINGAGGPDENKAGAHFCAQRADGTYGAPGDGSTFINAGTIFTDPSSGYMEICKSDGSVASYVGACFNRFCSTPGCSTAANACPPNYKAVPNPGNPFQNVTSYSCCFANGSTNNYTQSGCFSVFSSGSSWPAFCSSVDPNAYDMGCQCFESGCSAVRTCCFNSGNGSLLLNQPSSCVSASCPSVSGPVDGTCTAWGACSALCGNGTETCTASTLPQCGGSSAIGTTRGCTGSSCSCGGGTPCGTYPSCTSIPVGACDCAGHVDGCDGLCNSGKVNGCDGGCNSGKVNDACGVCGGTAGASCAGGCGCTGDVCKVQDLCGTCGGSCTAVNGEDCNGTGGTCECAGSTPCGSPGSCTSIPSGYCSCILNKYTCTVYHCVKATFDPYTCSIDWAGSSQSDTDLSQNAYYYLDGDCSGAGNCGSGSNNCCAAGSISVPDPITVCRPNC